MLTLTGAGGAGKTRLAIQVAGQLSGEFGDGVWYVDLAPITDPELVPFTVARAFGLPDQPGRSTMDTLIRFVADRQMLVVLDNCEHLLDASAALVSRAAGAAAGLTLLATSREPIGVAGEVSWRVPSLSLADEAIELFADRARRARPDFTLTDDNAAVVAEICARLDGLPLAIELAAARVRALSLAEILDSLHDRFRLLTGGARTAVRRQQTLRASVDWSHALLTEPERVLFRRLAAFLGGFDLDAAQAVAGGGDVERYPGAGSTHSAGRQVAGGGRRHAEAEPATGCWRRCANTRWKSSASPAKPTPCAHATVITTRRWPPCSTRRQAVIMSGARAGRDRDRQPARRVRWSRENSDIELALALASSLQPLWHPRRIREGLTWFDTALADLDAKHPEVTPAVRARALADRAFLGILAGAGASLDQAQQALAIAREVDDPALLVRALTACGYIASYFDAEAGPGVPRRGHRPGPGIGRPVAAHPDPRRASLRGSRRG